MTDLQKHFFCNHNGYPLEELVVSQDANAIDIVSSCADGRICGALTVFLEKKLPLEQYIDISELNHNQKSICEIRWFCIEESLLEEESAKVIIDLLNKTYTLLLEKNIEIAVISISERNQGNIARFKKLGFKLLDSYIHPRMGLMAIVYGKIDKTFIDNINRKEIKNTLVDIGNRYLPAKLDIREDFATRIDELKGYVENIKQQCTEFDRKNRSAVERIAFIQGIEEEFMKNLQQHYIDISNILNQLRDLEFLSHKRYYQDKLNMFFLEAITTKRCYEKPLGYAGDYIMMENIYEHHENYGGDSTYTTLINRYNCTIQFARSNIRRKELLKATVYKTATKSSKHKILSVGSGSGREIVEIVQEGKLSNLNMNFLDMDNGSLRFIETKLEPLVKNQMSFNYVNENIINLIKGRVSSSITGCDLIYASGLYDYLSDKVASKLTNVLFDMLNENGQLIICNASSTVSADKAYIELICEWFMKYRNVEELTALSENLDGDFDVSVSPANEDNVYNFLQITKK